MNEDPETKIGDSSVADSTLLFGKRASVRGLAASEPRFDYVVF